MSENRVLRGLSISEMPNSSFAEYFWPKIRSFPQDGVILVDGETGESYTIAKYLTKSLQLLEGMKSLGVKHGHVVAMLLRNSFEANEVMLGCWLGNIAVAPMNGSLKVAELNHSFTLIKPKVVFCDYNIVNNVVDAVKDLTRTPVIVVVDSSQDSKFTFIKYDDLKEETAVEAFKPQSIESPETKVLVIPPSSGTSGFPKGIGLTHRNIIFMDTSLGLTNLFEDDYDFLQVSHFFWVTGIIAFVRSLTVGTKRIFIKNPNNPYTILRAIDKYKIQCSVMAPLFWLGLVKLPKFRNYDISSLQSMILGGSALTPSILKGIRQECPNLKIFEVYGLTEAGGIISYSNGGDGHIGKVCPGIELKVIDLKTGEPLEANIPGEVCVRSPGVMKCYFGNEEQTKESIDNEGWLHSGDVAYYDESENLHFVERIKEMIKVENMQVAPAEIENVISKVNGVVEVGVVGIPNEIKGFLLVALVVKHQNCKITEQDIHSVVDATLSEYKRLTGGVFFVDNIPKTETGKIKRNLLRAMAENYVSQ